MSTKSPMPDAAARNNMTLGSAETMGSKGESRRGRSQRAASKGRGNGAPQQGATLLNSKRLFAVLHRLKKGDFTVRLPVDLAGLEGKIADTFNEVVELNQRMAHEIARVSSVVGKEGRISQRAALGDATGSWATQIASVNELIDDLVHPTRETARVIGAVAKGDLSQSMALDIEGRPIAGEFLRTARVVNTMVDQLSSFASEVTRVAREVGTEGKLGGQAEVKGVAGTWKDLTDNVNSMAGNLTSQVRNIAAVTTAVANGDLSKKITVDVRGEILELKDTINTMVDQLNSFASEVTRVAREVGTEGKLGGQAEVQGVAGTWKDLTDNVNSMAGNLTNQVRGIAKVVTAVANGDLNRKLAVEAKGEIAELADTINGMIDTLATFAEQVTGVAREVGVQGELGGQASVPGAAGTWKGLTDNVNQLAANLTTQVRAIADVATAVTRGDLTRSIDVAAQGEVAALKDNINEMIRNLRETTLKNAEQDWLKTNLAKFSRMLQGQEDLLTVGRLILSELAPVVNAQHGVLYILEASDPEPRLNLLASYAYKEREGVTTSFRLGEGLVGQCALEKKKILLTQVTEHYIRITSGLGEAPPSSVIVMPVVFESRVKAVLELASFDRFSETHQAFLDQLAESIGIVINTIEASTLTENLLTQSQSLAGELQSRQEELQKTNAELEDKARLLAQQNAEVERKNQEVEQARQALEEKAAQLALTSKYKSEFLANMSHELRTPLNSLLMLSDHLSKNLEENLSPRQVEFARTIHSSGNDLLSLINDILDLSKIESGMVAVDVGEIKVRDLVDYVERTFRHVADSKGLKFKIEIESGVPRSVHSDAKRLQQVLKNLLSNAFKFTDHGRVSLRMDRVAGGWTPGNEMLDAARSVVAFSVSDTGVGIPEEKQQIVFEAFQQVDGSTSRKYGGTGLGLAISREIARYLGGELKLISGAGKGSTFTLYLPQMYLPLKTSRHSVAEVEAGGALSAGELESAHVVGSVAPQAVNLLSDDRADVQPGDRVLLIVESEVSFSRVLIDAAHENGWKAIAAPRGASVLSTSQQYRPTGIILDSDLRDVDGWLVLERLKDDLNLRHIPVHVIAGADERSRALRLGAAGVVSEPIARPGSVAGLFSEISRWAETRPRRLLVVESHPDQHAALVELLSGPDLELRSCGSGDEALSLARRVRPEMLLVGLEDGQGGVIDLLERISGAPDQTDVPLLVHASRQPTESEEDALARVGERMLLKVVRSRELLVNETALRLHRPVENLPEGQREVIRRLRERRIGVNGKTVLIVDDDIRNIFAMTSLLERYQMKIMAKESAREAIEALQGGERVDIILMDIMMPDLDGYDAIQMIRRMEAFRSLPIIALTAKAMKGDREKCMEAGASDYIAKPVDSDYLLAKLQSWLLV